MPSPKVKYGLTWSTQDDAAIELEMIKCGGFKTFREKRYGNGLPFHVKAFCKIAWPWIHWHRWNEDLILPEICKGGRIAVFGPSNSGKSFMASVAALTFYFARPHETTVLCSTTTREDLELRIWGEIKKLFKKAKERIPWLPGHLIESKQTISTDSKFVEGRDFRNGIIGRPCKKGNEWVGLTSFVGIKNKYMYLICDESNLMSDGFLRSIANLTANPNCTSVIMGNLNDLNTPLGEAAEPENGWDALPDSDKSRVYKTRWMGGRAIQLVGKDSPQLDFPADKEPYGDLIGRRYIEQCAHDYGEDTPWYNMFAGGKIPRGTLENKVITKAIFHKFNALEPVLWGSEPITKLYCADISYTYSHGDRTCGMPLAFGKDIEHTHKLAQLDRPTVYTPNDRNKGTVEEQLALQMKAECEKYGIPPSRVFYDGTGRSSFTAAIMRLWSTEVNPIEFGGSASERPNFMGRKYREGKNQGELLPCNEVFGKFVTEMWFALRYLVEADQLRGMTEEVMREAILRIYVINKSNKTDVEPKADMKLRLGRSPDLADCFVVGIEGARRLGFPLGKLEPENKNARGGRWLRDTNQTFSQMMREKELSTLN